MTTRVVAKKRTTKAASVPGERPQSAFDLVQRDIGALGAKMDALTAMMMASDAESKASRVEAKSERTELGRRLTSVEVSHQSLTKLVEADMADMSEVKPTIEAFKILRQRGIGALVVVGIAATMLGVSIGDGWARIAAFFTGLFD